MSNIASLDEARARAKTKARGEPRKLLPPGAADERISALSESVEFVYETILDLLGRIEALEERTRLPEAAPP
jgi:hypothetical protein